MVKALLRPLKVRISVCLGSGCAWVYHTPETDYCIHPVVVETSIMS